MKRILTALAVSLALVGTAQAQHRHYGHVFRAQHGYHHHHHGGHWSGGRWIVPAIIGGAVVYAATRPEPAVAQPAPVIVVPPSPQGQIILQNTGVVCPEGTAPFFNIRADRYGRTYYEFDTCK